MRGRSFAAGVLLVVAALLSGFLAGGFLASRVFAGTGMGWDRLADALGGVAIGTLVALVVAIGVLRRNPTARGRAIWAVVFLGIGALAWLGLLLVPVKPMNALLLPSPTLDVYTVGAWRGSP